MKTVKQIILAVAFNYHTLMMNLAKKLNMVTFHAYHRELQEQADYGYGRYERLNFWYKK